MTPWLEVHCNPLRKGNQGRNPRQSGEPAGFGRLDLLIALALIVLLLAAAASWYRSHEAELTIHWTTENELDIVGFNLYRSETIQGEYVKLNDRPIPRAADPLLGSQYSYVDADVVSGQTYYYILEIIDRNGQTRRRDPVTITAE